MSDNIDFLTPIGDLKCMTSTIIRKEPSKSAWHALTRLDYVLSPFTTYSRPLTCGYVRMLLRITRQPGIGVTELAKDLDEPQPKVSRSLLELGQKSRGISGSLELVDSEADVIDLRYKHYYLTPKGLELISHILGNMGI